MLAHPGRFRCVLLCDPIKSERGQNQRAAFSPDGRFCCRRVDRRSDLLDRNGEESGDFLPHNESVWSIIFTPDGRRLVTSSVDHVTKIGMLPRYSGYFLNTAAIAVTRRSATMARNSTCFQER